MNRILTLLIVVYMGCGGGHGGPYQAEQGTEGNACYPNNTCNAGLSCVSNLCVTTPPDGSGGQISRSGLPPLTHMFNTGGVNEGGIGGATAGGNGGMPNTAGTSANTGGTTAGGNGGMPNTAGTSANTGGATAGGNAGMPNTGGAQTNTGGTTAGGNAGMVRGLIGWWRFDEGSGTMVKDSSGHNNHGTVMQGASVMGAVTHPGPTWASGRTGGNDRALSISDLNTWVRVPDSDSIDRIAITNQVTVSAWIRLNQYNTLKPFNIIAQRHEVGTRIEQFMLGLNMGVPLASIHHFYMQGMMNIPINQWLHLAMTYDGITQKIFVNGNEVASSDVAWPITADDTPFTMGAGINDNEVSEHINGLIDEVRLYDIHLPKSEITALAR